MRDVVIVGTGLIGTSIGLALRRQAVSTHLLDHDPEIAGLAAKLGAGTVGVPGEPADLAVIAVPPSRIPSVLREQQRSGLARAYTDVGSVKAVLQSQADLLGCDPSSYLGGHPLAGRESNGPLAASADLFDGRPWVLTPSPTTSSATLLAGEELVRLCGARPMRMTHQEHDRAVALSSHVPHLMASVLAARLVDAEPGALELCGNGIRDTTRIAAGDEALWADILTGNAAEVADILAEVTVDLRAAERNLREYAAGDTAGAAGLTDVLRRGKAGRTALSSSRLPPHRGTRPDE
jgi:prephenate dehydrogenase